ncbi:TVP38/TMEM64 family protein [Microbacteriaceae bacterium 4G12]
MFKKISSIVLVSALLIFVYIYKADLFDWIKAGGVVSVMVSILFVALCAFFPIVPFPILGGIIGAMFGFWKGVGITLVGAMLGTMVVFFLVRYSFRDAAQRHINRWPKVKQYELLFEKNSFLSVWVSRMIPVIPAAAVNIIWGLSNVAWSTFFFASALGKLPNIFFVIVSGVNFEKNKWLSIQLYSIYIVVICTLNYIFIFRQRRKKKNDNGIR